MEKKFEDDDEEFEDEEESLNIIDETPVSLSRLELEDIIPVLKSREIINLESNVRNETSENKELEQEGIYEIQRDREGWPETRLSYENGKDYSSLYDSQSKGFQENHFKDSSNRRGDVFERRGSFSSNENFNASFNENRNYETESDKRLRERRRL